VTGGPLVALWHDAAARDALPDPAALAAARARGAPVGSTRAAARAVRALRSRRAARSTSAASRKGYAIDRVRVGLGAGVDAALLSFGQSSAWAIGRPPDCGGLAPARARPRRRIRGRAHAARQRSPCRNRSDSGADRGRRTGTCSTRAAESRSRAAARRSCDADATLAKRSPRRCSCSDRSRHRAGRGVADAEALLLDADGKRCEHAAGRTRHTTRRSHPWPAQAPARSFRSSWNDATRADLPDLPGRYAGWPATSDPATSLLLVAAARPASIAKKDNSEELEVEEDF